MESNGQPNGKATLYAAMAKVLGEIKRVPKDGVNAHFNYRYAREGDLVEELRPALAKHGLALIFSIGEISSGSKSGITRVLVTMTIGCGESGAESVSTWYGEAMDTGDKGLYKAYTGAVKYALMKTFLMSTGDDPEADESDEQPRAKAPQPKPAEQPKPAQPPSNGAPVEMIEMTIDGKQYRVPFAFDKLPDDALSDYTQRFKKLTDAKTVKDLAGAWLEIEEAHPMLAEAVYQQLSKVNNYLRKKLSQPVKAA